MSTLNYGTCVRVSRAGWAASLSLTERGESWLDSEAAFEVGGCECLGGVGGESPQGAARGVQARDEVWAVSVACTGWERAVRGEASGRQGRLLRVEIVRAGCRVGCTLCGNNCVRLSRDGCPYSLTPDASPLPPKH